MYVYYIRPTLSYIQLLNNAIDDLNIHIKIL